MPFRVRASLAIAVAGLALALASSASAATPYDPDVPSFSSTPSADLSVTLGTCTFDTTTGSISGAGCTSARGAGGDGTVVDGIGVFVIPTSTPNQADTTEFVMRSLTMASGAAITHTGANNLVIATLHDLTVGTGASVNVDGLGEAGGDPGDGGAGPGGGDHSVVSGSSCPVAGGGGSFGGFGGDGGNGVPGGGIYGSSPQSTLLGDGSGGGGGGTGSGCGTVGGGNGGGGLGLVAMGALTVNGSVSANGTPTSATSLSDQGGPGGGSGGSILFMTPHLVLANQSVAQAKGGFGYSTSIEFGSGGGGGGGGRITAVSDQTSNPFNFLATGGGLGGVQTDGSGIGLDGGGGNGGSLGALPFLTVSGPSSKPAGQAAGFTSSTAFGNATFAWDFGDGGTGTGANPSHTYPTGGHYTATVTATMVDSGQTATANRSITITAPPPSPPASPVTPVTPVTPPAVHCVVPKLSGLSLAGAKRKLKAAHCKLGKVTKPRLKKSQKHRPLIVSRQSQKAGKQLAEGTAVSLTLGPKKAKRRHHH